MTSIISAERIDEIVDEQIGNRQLTPGARRILIRAAEDSAASLGPDDESDTRIYSSNVVDSVVESGVAYELDALDGATNIVAKIKAIRDRTS